MAKWQRINIKLRKQLGPNEREAVGLEIIEQIKKNTLQGKDRFGNKWTGPAGKYSESYKKSLDFKIKRKTGNVDLRLSGEMLNNLKIISHRSGQIIIGYDKNNSELNGKVEGNRLGTYGKKTGKTSKARDFLGISASNLREIERKYTRGSKEDINKKVSAIKSVLSASVLPKKKGESNDKG